MQLKRPYNYIILLVILLLGIAFLFPYLFTKIIDWQREFNQLIGGCLRAIKQQPMQAGTLLIGICFLYGIFHAVGPGHGKFVIASYLATHQSKLKAGMALSLLSSLMQGVVAVVATSIAVLVLQLSSAYFKLSQLWMERVAFGLILLLGLQWVYQSSVALCKQWQPAKTALQVNRIHFAESSDFMKPSAVKKTPVFHRHSEHCGCGHRHLPDASQLEQANNLKSKFLVILSIGMRPCSGAIFVLFLAYMLNLYWWGILATMMMALGTGLMLSGFALMVQYARSSAIKLGQWYLSPNLSLNLEDVVKLAVGAILIFFAVTLIYGTTLQERGGAVLFGV
ncbi:zinc transporter permease subunit ZevB [Actinobacillus seminis]|uniref:zinc transporter permease subunit ZevB n=1 Tax=Actinobacillus seminis TaxID=722 RepID=UPI003B93C41C